MRRAITWNDEASQEFDRFAYPLPGRHDPPNLDALAGDVALIIEALAERFEAQEDHGHSMKRVVLQEPLAAGLITVFARLVDPATVEIVDFDAWPPGQPPDERDW